MGKPDMAAILAAAREKREQKERESKLMESIRETNNKVVGSGAVPQAPISSPPKLGEKPTGGIDFKARLAALRAKKGEPTPAPDNVTKVEPKPYIPLYEEVGTTHNPVSSFQVYKDKEEAAYKTKMLAVEKPTKPEPLTHIGIDGSVITYNTEQEEFVTLLSSGKSCVLIGSAGTGKTTCTQGAIQSLIQTGNVPVLQTDGHKHLKGGSPGVVTISYTRRAVNNIKKVLPADLKGNCITAHKLLEFAPEYFEIWDEESQKMRKTMAFVPTRNAINPLPRTIHTIIVEESSMVDLELFGQITAALLHKVQWVFIGDIQQLPPVFGSAILGYKMLELPVVQLTQVYRQALESPIIRLAQRILSGKPIPAAEYESWKVESQLTIHPWKKKLHPDTAVATLAAFFTRAYDAEEYNIEEDMILIPYNKACGTLELNRYIANHIARTHNRDTYEVIAGFNKHYFSIGDKVLYDKEDAEIVEINTNPTYSGTRPQPESKTLDYWGHNPNLAEESYTSDSDGMDIDLILSQAAGAAGEERVTQSSHNLVVKLLDTCNTVNVTKAADVNAMLHAYALTVHKSQGSEWRKVFLCLHTSHATMLQRELLYTAVTRAREELYVICEPESFTKGIKSQKIKGNTLAEKAEFFKGKRDKKEQSLAPTR